MNPTRNLAQLPVACKESISQDLRRCPASTRRLSLCRFGGETIMLQALQFVKGVPSPSRLQIPWWGVIVGFALRSFPLLLTTAPEHLPNIHSSCLQHLAHRTSIRKSFIGQRHRRMAVSHPLPSGKMIHINISQALTTISPRKLSLVPSPKARTVPDMYDSVSTQSR